MPIIIAVPTKAITKKISMPTLAASTKEAVSQPTVSSSSVNLPHEGDLTEPDIDIEPDGYRSYHRNQAPLTPP